MAEIVVIGAGIGGIASATYLADAGHEVTVLEKNEQLGGRASVLERDGFRFDMGPSWYLMPDVFERYFGHFDSHPGEWYDLEPLDPHYRLFFKDGDRIDIADELDSVKSTFERYQTGAGEKLDDYLRHAEMSYDVGMEHFVYTDRSRFRDYLDWTVAKQARGLGLLGSMQGHVEEYFTEPKLQQIIQHSLVFLGGSPSNTPALYNLMAHVDLNLGVFYPEGGIASVIDGLVGLAQSKGVRFITETTVEHIDGERGAFEVVTRERGPVSADIVVSNADYAHTEQELLPPTRRRYGSGYWSSRTLVPSAFLLYLGVEGSLDPIYHHTLVLPTDWSAHFDSIFNGRTWPADPAYYICHPSMTDPDVAPAGHEALFVLVPIAPGLEDDLETRHAFRDKILDDIERHTGVRLRDRIVLEEHFAVSDFASRYNAQEGTALGLAHTLRQTGPLRPDHRSSRVDGLYFTGGDTRPGIGMPMCLISAEHVAQAIEEDR